MPAPDRTDIDNRIIRIETDDAFYPTASFHSSRICVLMNSLKKEATEANMGYSEATKERLRLKNLAYWTPERREEARQRSLRQLAEICEKSRARNERQQAAEAAEKKARRLLKKQSKGTLNVDC